MKPYLLALVIILFSGLMLGFVLPVLFSAKDDGLVVWGVAALVGYLAGLGLLIRQLIKSLKKNEDYSNIRQIKN